MQAFVFSTHSENLDLLKDLLKRYQNLGGKIDDRFKTVYLNYQNSKISAQISTYTVRNAMEEATLHGNLEAIKWLKEKSASLNPTRKKDSNTLLMYAAERGHFKVVQYLIAQGVEINDDMPSFQTDVLASVTALTIAIQNRHFNIARLLLEKGATFNKFEEKRLQDIKDEKIRLRQEVGDDLERCIKWIAPEAQQAANSEMPTSPADSLGQSFSTFQVSSPDSSGASSSTASESPQTPFKRMADVLKTPHTSKK